MAYVTFLYSYGIGGRLLSPRMNASVTVRVGVND
jgi:hypothetical protein